jgi:hypothetical protein
MTGMDIIVHLLGRSLEGLIYGAFCYIGALLVGFGFESPRSRAQQYAGCLLFLAASVVFWLYPWRIALGGLAVLKKVEILPVYFPLGIVLAIATWILGALAGSWLYRSAFEHSAARLRGVEAPEDEPAAAPVRPIRRGAGQIPSDHFAALVADATLLLDYAIENGILGPGDRKMSDPIIKGIQRGQEQLSDQPADEDARAAFMAAYRDLALFMSPITADTLKATSDQFAPRPKLFRFLKPRSAATKWSRKLSAWTIFFIAIAVAGRVLDMLLEPIGDRIGTDRPDPTPLLVIQAVLQNLVPFTYGAIGACISLFKTTQSLIHLRQFDPRRISEYYVQILLGAVSGGIIIILIEHATNTSGGMVKLSAAALGFIAGYNSELLFSAIDRISAAVLPKPGSESEKQGAKQKST